MFALFRLATLCQGTMGLGRDGTASDPGARRHGERPGRGPRRVGPWWNPSRELPELS